MTFQRKLTDEQINYIKVNPHKLRRNALARKLKVDPSVIDYWKLMKVEPTAPKEEVCRHFCKDHAKL